MKFKKIIVLLVLLPALLAVAGGGGAYIYFTRALPAPSTLRDYTPNLITKVYAKGGEVIGEFYIERRIVVSLKKMPPHLIKAFLAAEDAKFYQHKGLDFSGILRAFIVNLKAGRIVQGGSTITQQVAKSFFLSSERKLPRKIKEALLASRMEEVLTKDEILHLYLNQIYFGSGAYGVQAASESYFGKDIEEVNLAEAALLASLPKAPSRYSPYRNPELSRTRQEIVIRRMIEEGYISKGEAEAALETPIELKPKDRRSLWIGRYYTEHIRRHLEDAYGSDLLYKGGLHVYTNLDVTAQKAANNAVREGLRGHDRRRGFRGVEKRLTTAEEMAEFVEDSKGEFKKYPMVLKHTYKGMVTGVDDENYALKIYVGGRRGTISKKDLRWARLKYTISEEGDEGTEMTKYSDLFENFAIGDVVDVLIKNIPEDKGKELILALDQTPLAQAALIAIEPETGYVRAMVGGGRFSRTQFNRAVQAKRQPGSAFKPIIYAAAIDRSYTAASIIVDSPLIFEEEIVKDNKPSLNDADGVAILDDDKWGVEFGGDGLSEYFQECVGSECVEEEEKSVWKPRNYGEKFYGPTTLREALTKSRNVVTIKLLKEIGVKPAIRLARKLGITSHLAPDLSLALGSSAMSLLEITRAYAAFPNLGYLPEPIFINRVTDRYGNTLEENEPFLEKVISPQTAYIMTNLLQGVVEDGTGKRAKVLKAGAGGKTGTTNNLNDALFVGFIPGLVTGTWVGYDSEKYLGPHETGAKAALPIWVDFLKVAKEDLKDKTFEIPDGVEFARIDPKSGLLARPDTKDSIFEVFKVGTKPTEYVEKKVKVKRPVDFFMLDSGDEGL